MSPTLSLTSTVKLTSGKRPGDQWLYRIVHSVYAGYELPLLGLGVYQNNECKPACLAASKHGYTYVSFPLPLYLLLTRVFSHIDSARLYRNEAQVGEAVRESGVPREKIFVSASHLSDRAAARCVVLIRAHQRLR